MRTALQTAQRLSTVTSEIARHKQRLANIGEPRDRHERRAVTMAKKMLKRHEAELQELAAADATCIGCSCTDSRACAGGCYWVHVDRVKRSGVCSNCPSALKAWRNQRGA